LSIRKEPACVPDSVIQQQQGWGIATLMARKTSTAREIGQRLQMDLPQPRRVSEAGPVCVISTGPGTWLALNKVPDDNWAPNLADLLEGVASISEQSSGYALLALSGADTRRLLQAAACIDLREDAFPPGCAAPTVISYIGVTLWRPLREERFLLAVYRSYLGSLETCLQHISATL
jgi:sarcosine oxidase subunit gamma